MFASLFPTPTIIYYYWYEVVGVGIGCKLAKQWKVVGLYAGTVALIVHQLVLYIYLLSNKCKCTAWVSPRYYTVIDPMLLPSGNPFKCHEEVLYLQPMIPPKRFYIFPPDWGMLRRSRCVQIFL